MQFIIINSRLSPGIWLPRHNLADQVYFAFNVSQFFAGNGSVMLSFRQYVCFDELFLNFAEYLPTKMRALHKVMRNLQGFGVSFEVGGRIMCFRNEKTYNGTP